MSIINSIVTYVSKATNQEKLIQYLREVDFHFVSMEVLKQWKEEGFTELDIWPDHEMYSFMIRETKNIVGDRCEYDFRLAIGFKMHGPRKSRVLIYLNNEFHSKVKVPWLDKDDINFRKMKITLKFPDEMEDYVERRKWRVEHLKLQRFPEKYTPSAFYLKWKDKITIMEPERFYHGSHHKK